MADVGDSIDGDDRPVARQVATPPLRGCDRHLASLDGAIAGVMDGQPGVVLVEGSAGYGKSRLLAEPAHRARIAGARVGWVVPSLTTATHRL